MAESRTPKENRLVEEKRRLLARYDSSTSVDKTRGLADLRSKLSPREKQLLDEALSEREARKKQQQLQEQLRYEVPINRTPMTLFVADNPSDRMVFQYIPNDFSISVKPKWDGGSPSGGTTEVVTYGGQGAKTISFTMFLNDIGEGEVNVPDPRTTRVGPNSDKNTLRTPVHPGLAFRPSPEEFGPGNVENILRWLEDKSSPGRISNTLGSGGQATVESQQEEPPTLIFTAGPWFRSLKGTVIDSLAVVISKLEISNIIMDSNFIRIRADASVTLMEKRAELIDGPGVGLGDAF